MQQARQQAADFRFKFGYEVPVDYLAKVLADKAQVYTQVRPWGRPCAQVPPKGARKEDSPRAVGAEGSPAAAGAQS